MKKLNLLKPDIQNGYLNNGKGQEINYLEIPLNVGIRELKEDVKNGAKQYSELIDFVEKKPSQFVVINCNNEEEGLMAVSYLAAIYNMQDKLCYGDYDDDNEVSDKVELEYEEYDDRDIFDDDFEASGGEDDNWENNSQWNENPWQIPIITSDEICSKGPFGFEPYYNGGLGFGSTTNTKNNLPYWFYTRKENVCILHSGCQNLFSYSCNQIGKELKRFKNNRHVFLVIVSKDKAGCDDCEEWLDPLKEEIYEIILEYAAGMFHIKTEEEAVAKYYSNLFENWVYRYGYALKKSFPVKRITKSIVAMNNPDKSALIEKVIRYVIKDEKETRILGEEDFSILAQFKLLGADLKKKEHKSMKKLENELIGMEAVKEQIRGIVEVMRYNKRRMKMGLSTGNYHNVHMLLGAPGTAKTTVAEILGNIMAEEKLLADNRFISVNGAELKGMYVGHSAPKVKALFDNYDIIFIDEAYAVAAGNDGESDSFSQEAIAQLIVELEKHGMDRLVMFAGYGGFHVTDNDNKMKRFMDCNPGIRSRINSTIYFDSYTADQMVEIFRGQAKMNEFTITPEANEVVRQFFVGRVMRNDFGNGREARSLLENSMVEAAKRLSKVPDDKLTVKLMKEIQLQDIKKAIERMQQSAKIQTGREKKQLGFL